MFKDVLEVIAYGFFMLGLISVGLLLIKLGAGRFSEIEKTLLGEEVAEKLYEESDEDEELSPLEEEALRNIDSLLVITPEHKDGPNCPRCKAYSYFEDDDDFHQKVSARLGESISSSRPVDLAEEISVTNSFFSGTHFLQNRFEIRGESAIISIQISKDYDVNVDCNFPVLNDSLQRHITENMTETFYKMFDEAVLRTLCDDYGYILKEEA